MVAQPEPREWAAFMALPDDGSQHEFVRGEIRVMPPSKGRHRLIETALLAAIDRHLDQRARAMGWEPEQGLDARHRLVGFVAGGEYGMQYSLPDDQRQVRGADGVYVPAEQYAGITWHEDSYFPGVPALVIEVISASETATDVSEKVQDYLTAGAHRVWCLYPLRHTVHIHDAQAPTRVVRINESLTDDELLPVLAIPLRLIFPTP